MVGERAGIKMSVAMGCSQQCSLLAMTVQEMGYRPLTCGPLDLTDTLKTMQNLGLTVTDELRIPLTLPEGRRCLLYRFGIE